MLSCLGPEHILLTESKPSCAQSRAKNTLLVAGNPQPMVVLLSVCVGRCAYLITDQMQGLRVYYTPLKSVGILPWILIALNV